MENPSSKKETKTAWAVNSIKDYLIKYYNLDLSEHDLGFLNAVIQDVDSDAWKKGYDDCAEDANVY